MHQENTLIKLKRGAILIKTYHQGYIQLGIPLNGFLELEQLEIETPLVYIIPQGCFHKKLAINLAEIQSVALPNFLKGLRTKIVCTEQVRNQIESFFNLTNNVCQQIDQKVPSYDANVPTVNLEQEISYIQTIIQKQNKDINFSQCIEYIVFDDQGEAIVNEDLLIKLKQNQYFVYERGIEIAVVSEDIEITLVQEVNWDEEIRRKYEVMKRQTQTIKSMKHENSISRFKQQSDKDDIMQSSLQNSPPAFGITFLDNLQTSHSPNHTRLSIGFIIWINGRGALVDPPLYISQQLKKLQITPSLIEWIILTSNDSQNDAGAFQKIFDSSKIDIVTTEPIRNAFIKKYSLLSGMPVSLIHKVIKFKPVTIGAPLNLKGAIFKFFQTFNSTPSLGFELNYGNKGLVYWGETFLTKDLLSLEGKIMTKQRIQALTTFRWNYFNLMLIYVGVHPWNTTLETLKEFIPQQQRKKFFIMERETYNSQQNKFMEAGFLTMNPPLNTLTLQETGHRSLEFMKKVDLLSSIEVFENISIKNFRDLLQCVREEKFKSGENVIREGTLGSKFYFIVSGIIKISLNKENNKFERYYSAGSYFGETALLKADQKRGADVTALTDCELLSVERCDFWFIFGERGDDAGPVIKRLFSLFEARKSKALNFINLNSLFSEFNTYQKTQLEMILSETTIKQNQTLWTAGDTPKFCYLLARGTVKFIECPEEELPPFDQPGMFFGELSAIISNLKLTTSMICLKESQIFMVERQDIIQFFNENPGLFMQFSNLKYFV